MYLHACDLLCISKRQHWLQKCGNWVLEKGYDLPTTIAEDCTRADIKFKLPDSISLSGILLILSFNEDSQFKDADTHCVLSHIVIKDMK